MSKTNEKDQFIIKAGVLETKKQISVKLLIFLLLFVCGFMADEKLSPSITYPSIPEVNMNQF